MFTLRVATVALLVIGFSSTASAHIRMTDPKPRSNSDSLKSGPCGGVASNGQFTQLQPGQQVTVKWTETVDHFGCFQVAFSENGEAGPFKVLKQIDDPQGDTTPRNLQTNITLPNGVTCKNCIIQTRQLMINRYCKGSPMLDAGAGVEDIATLGAGDVYFGCADVRVGDFDAGPTPTDGGSSGTTSSSSSSGTTSSSSSSSSSSGTSGEGPITTRPDGGEDGLLSDGNGDKSEGCSTSGGASGTSAAFGFVGALVGLTLVRRTSRRRNTQ